MVSDVTKEPQTRAEYRAIYSTPWSPLDPPEFEQQGYVEHASEYGTDKECIKRDTYALRRSEETWAVIRRWEKRTVIVGEWVHDG